MMPETEAFLDLVRHAEGPSEDDEQRVLRALQTAVAAGVTPSVAVTASPCKAWHAAWSNAWVSTISKLSVVAVGTSVGLSVAPERTPTPPTPSAAIAPAPTLTRSDEPRQLAAPAVASALPLRRSPPISVPAPKRSRNAPAPSLGVELRTLEDAQRALRAGDSESALRALDATSNVDGPLRPERQAARILALCASGRATEARAAIAIFLAEYPESAHRAAIASACAQFSMD